MVGVSSSLLLAWAAGAAIGPTVAAPFIDLLGPSGLFLYSFLVAAGLATFVLWRMTRRGRPPPAKDGFVNLPATSRAWPTSTRACPSSPVGLDAPAAASPCRAATRAGEARPT